MDVEQGETIVEQLRAANGSVTGIIDGLQTWVLPQLGIPLGVKAERKVPPTPEGDPPAVIPMELGEILRKLDVVEEYVDAVILKLGTRAVDR